MVKLTFRHLMNWSKVRKLEKRFMLAQVTQTQHFPPALPTPDPGREEQTRRGADPRGLHARHGRHSNEPGGDPAAAGGVWC